MSGYYERLERDMRRYANVASLGLWGEEDLSWDRIDFRLLTVSFVKIAELFRASGISIVFQVFNLEGLKSLS